MSQAGDIIWIAGGVHAGDYAQNKIILTSVKGLAHFPNAASFEPRVKEAMKEQVIGFICEDEGASAVEYAVLIALIIAVCIFVIWGIGKQVNNAFDKANKTWIKTTTGS